MVSTYLTCVAAVVKLERLPIFTLHFATLMMRSAALELSQRSSSWLCISFRHWVSKIISSAKSRSFRCSIVRGLHGNPRCGLLSIDPARISSIMMRNSSGNRMHPCLTPTVTLIRSDKAPSCKMLHENASYCASMRWTSLSGTPLRLRALQMLSWLSRSKAFSKSTNTSRRES